MVVSKETMVAATGSERLSEMSEIDSVLIYELQLQDIEELISEERGKGLTVAKSSILESSLVLQKVEIVAALQVVRDMQMSKSIARAVRQDANAIESVNAQERQAQSDREFACRLGGIPVPPPPRTTKCTLPQTSRTQASAAVSSLQPRQTCQRPSSSSHSSSLILLDRYSSPQEPPIMPFSPSAISPSDNSRQLYAMPPPPPIPHAYSRQRPAYTPQVPAYARNPANIPLKCGGTRTTKFFPYVEREFDSLVTHRSSFQNICFRSPYQSFSTDELRLADYSENLRYENAFDNLHAFVRKTSEVKPSSVSGTQNNAPSQMCIDRTGTQKESPGILPKTTQSRDAVQSKVYQDNETSSNRDCKASKPCLNADPLAKTDSQEVACSSTVGMSHNTKHMPCAVKTKQSLQTLNSSRESPIIIIQQSEISALKSNSNLEDYRIELAERFTNAAVESCTNNDEGSLTSTSKSTAQQVQLVPLVSTSVSMKRSLEEVIMPDAKRIDTGASKEIQIFSNPVVTSAKQTFEEPGLSEPKRGDTRAGNLSHDIPKAASQTTKRSLDNLDLPTPKRLDTGIGKSQNDETVDDLFGKVTCASCTDTYGISYATQAPCGHTYCRDCLCTIVKNSLADEDSFPPKCCKKAFVLEGVKQHLTDELTSEYGEKIQEFGTANRVYCSDPRCSAFLYPVNISTQENIGICPLCFVVTCTICKGAEHIGECPKDGDMQNLLKLAKDQGWRNCGKCHRMIELKHGCNHITCKCKAEWCYVCGAKWKTCACPQWNEDNLIERAQRAQPIVNEQNPGPVQGVHQTLAHARQAIEQYHDNCCHSEWERLNGVFICDECDDEMDEYINRCQGCYLDLCNICRSALVGEDSHDDSDGDSDDSEDDCVHGYCERIGGMYRCDDCGDYMSSYINRCQDCSALLCGHCLNQY